YAEHTTLNKEKMIRSFNENLSSIKIMSGIFVKQKKKNNRNSLKDLNESYISLVFLNGISADDPAGLSKHIKENRELFLPLILLKILMNDSSDTNQKKDYLFDKLMLDRVLSSAFEQWGHNFEKIIEEINLVKILSRDLELYSPAVLESPSKTKQTYTRERMLIEKIFSGKDYLTYLNYNDFNGVKYYSKERFENLISWIFTLENLMKIRDLIFSGTGKAKKVSEKRINTSEYLKEFKKSEIFYSNIWDASGKTGYKAEELKEIFTPGKESVKRMEKITSSGKKKTERAGNNEKNAKNVKRKIVTRRSK
ncbi:MAG: hypothetical protein ACM34N_09160, partial [Ignavibacteria bacterium]